MIAWLRRIWHGMVLKAALHHLREKETPDSVVWVTAAQSLKRSRTDSGWADSLGEYLCCDDTVEEISDEILREIERLQTALGIVLSIRK